MNHFFKKEKGEKKISHKPVCVSKGKELFSFFYCFLKGYPMEFLSWDRTVCTDV